MAIDLPPAIHERVVCSISASAKYGVPANILLAVAEREGGRPGQWVRNTNGTYDLGSMQFNTAYIRTLARYGIGPTDVTAAGCFAFDLAAWRLRRHIRDDRGDLWTRVANYHSRTPRFNAPYRVQIMRSAAKWGSWLTQRYQTYTAADLVVQQATPAKQRTTAADRWSHAGAYRQSVSYQPRAISSAGD